MAKKKVKTSIGETIDVTVVAPTEVAAGVLTEAATGVLTEAAAGTQAEAVAGAQAEVGTEAQTEVAAGTQAEAAVGVQTEAAAVDTGKKKSGGKVSLKDQINASILSDNRCIRYFQQLPEETRQAKFKILSDVRGRAWHIEQNCRHPETGEILWTEKDIKAGYEKLKKTIGGNGGYILHDKDFYTEDDEAADPKHKANTPKAPHWHVIFKTFADHEDQSKARVLSAEECGRFFNVNPNCCTKLTNRQKAKNGAVYNVNQDCKKPFANMCRYFLHETRESMAAGKFHYDDDEFKPFGDFEIRAYIEKYKKAEHHTKRDFYNKQVVCDGKTAAEIRDEDPYYYSSHFQDLERGEKKGKSRGNLNPEHRISLYFQGQSASGKSTVSAWIAQALGERELTRTGYRKNKQGKFPEEMQSFCIPPGGKVVFDGYCGQPVLVFDDVRTKDILANAIIGDIHGLLRLLEPHPRFPEVKHVKFDITHIIQMYTIFNCCEPMEKFFGDLMKGERQKQQMSRRIPIIVQFEEDEQNRKFFRVLKNEKLFGLGTDITNYKPVSKFYFDPDRYFLLEKHRPPEEMAKLRTNIMTPIMRAINEYEKIMKDGRDVSEEELQEIEVSFYETEEDEGVETCLMFPSCDKMKPEVLEEILEARVPSNLSAYKAKAMLREEVMKNINLEASNQGAEFVQEKLQLLSQLQLLSSAFGAISFFNNPVRNFINSNSELHKIVGNNYVENIARTLEGQYSQANSKKS